MLPYVTMGYITNQVESKKISMDLSSPASLTIPSSAGMYRMLGPGAFRARATCAICNESNNSPDFTRLVLGCIEGKSSGLPDRAVQPSLPGHLRVEEGLVEHALPPPERIQHVEREHGQVELVEGVRDLASFTLRAIP